MKRQLHAYGWRAVGLTAVATASAAFIAGAWFVGTSIGNGLKKWRSLP